MIVAVSRASASTRSSWAWPGRRDPHSLLSPSRTRSSNSGLGGSAFRYARQARDIRVGWATLSYSGWMDAAQRQLHDQIDDATQRLLGTARVIAEPDLRQPSLLPGWTRAHVLAHLARGADAMRTLMIGARSGQDRPAYASARGPGG